MILKFVFDQLTLYEVSNTDAWKCPTVAKITDQFRRKTAKITKSALSYIKQYITRTSRTDTVLLTDFTPNTVIK